MKHFLAIVFGLTLLALAGCGGSGGAAATAPATGVFSDSPVEGMRYVFGSYSGVTGPGGTFTYPAGTVGVFRIGDIVVGRTPGKPVVTVIDLVKTRHPEYTDAQARAQALKLVQFLTSIGGGADQTALTIPPQLLTTASGGSFGSFDLLMGNLQGLLDSLGTFTLTDATTAANHLDTSLANLGQARHAGEYVSVDTSGGSMVDLVIDSSGSVLGYCFDSSGITIQETGSVDAGGTVVLTGRVSRNDVGVPATGASDGAGTITGTVTMPGGNTYQMSLRRVTTATDPYVGIYEDFISGANLVFATDVFGNLLGVANPGARNMGGGGVVLRGKVDAATGTFTLSGLDTTFIGTISGTTASGTWKKGTQSGTFSGRKMD